MHTKKAIQKKDIKRLKHVETTCIHTYPQVKPCWPNWCGLSCARCFGTSFGIAWPKENHQLPISRVCCWNTLTLKPKKEQALEILWLHMMYSRGRTTQISTFIDLFKNTLCFRPALSIEEQMELALWLDVETFPFFVHPQNFKRKSGERHLR